MNINILPFTLGILMSLAAAMDAAKKKNNLSLVIDCNDNKPDPIAKIDCSCLDVEGKMSSLVAKKKMMKAVEVDIKKMAGNQKVVD
jgi:hypothetical protein